MTFTLLTGFLQLIVPSYAFRLVRRFGAQRVGWFVVTAFACMAMLHLLAPLQAFRIGNIPDLSTNVFCGIGSVLLLIGMGHMETVCSERERALRTEKELHDKAETRWKQETADLQTTNLRLLDEVTRLQLREKALGESAAQYGFLFEENPQPMWIVDLRTGGFMVVNKAAQRHLGFASDEMVDRNAADFLPPDWAGLFQTELTRPCPTAQARGIWPHVRKDGVVIEMEIGAIDLSCSETPARLIVAQDVTERQHHQADFLHAQKMEAVGKVSGGVGQQFSGILATIESNASHLLPRMTDLESVEQVKHISAAAVRGSGLTRQLLAIGSQQQIQPEVLDLNGLVRDMNHMLGKLVGDRITIHYSYGAFVAPILADPRLMEHILVNLVLNARDAIATSGQITISTTTVRLDKQGEDDRSPVGEFVKLSVRDSGCGMTPEVQAHVFEPFFTTRGAKAIGLGLASIYGIARQHSGWIEFSSEAGCGSEFRVFLPCAPAYELTTKQMRVASPVSKKTVLLVEPDDRARSMARCALDWQGYRVIEADSAQLALQLWERQSVKIDLLLTEAGTIGSLSGMDLAARLLRGKPSLKVVCTSDAKSKHVPAGTNPGVLKLLAKPFTREKLLAEIRMALDGEC